MNVCMCPNAVVSCLAMWVNESMYVFKCGSGLAQKVVKKRGTFLNVRKRCRHLTPPASRVSVILRLCVCYDANSIEE